MSILFPKGTKVWPVHRDPQKPKNTWCAKPVKLNRPVTIIMPPVSVDATKATVAKFSRFVELNQNGRRKYAIFLFQSPVPQDKNLVLGFVADTPR
jgi:hypothetical protein